MDVDAGAITVAVDSGADREWMLIAGTPALTCSPPAPKKTKQSDLVVLGHTKINKTKVVILLSTSEFGGLRKHKHCIQGRKNPTKNLD